MQVYFHYLVIEMSYCKIINEKYAQLISFSGKKVTFSDNKISAFFTIMFV